MRVKFLAQEHNSQGTRRGLKPGQLDPETSALYHEDNAQTTDKPVSSSIRPNFQ